MANPSKKEIPLQPLREEQVDQLARLINSGNCILVLGPYAALAPNTPQPIPLRAALAAALAAELGGDHVPDPHDLPMVCSAYMARPEAARLDLEFSVERFYRKHNNPGGLLEQVARLPFKLILTAGP
ncbi:MAG: hypothetical protein JNK89_06015, partial [Saprospiraceae bacterium]|nr:hypothetical protein [Saprospiraceae bacterium]